VFDQTKRGIIPTILADWYAQRKKFQAAKKDAGKAGDAAKVGYYDRLQYVYKIKLNSLYGALTNQYFRFYDLRMGESTTGTGRMILRHQCRKVGEILDGNYNFDIPMYATVKDAEEAGHKADVALYGPKFNGKFQSPSVVYGDTDSVVGSTMVDIDGDNRTIEHHFEQLRDNNTGTLLQLPNNVELLLLDGLCESPCIADEGWDYAPVSAIYRHKTTKRLFKITTSSGKQVTVTEDHSVMVVDEFDKLVERKPTELNQEDRVIEQKM